MKYLLLVLSIFVVAAAPSSGQTPESAKTLVDTCLGQFKQKDWSGAMASCSKAIELDPKSLDAYIYRAIIFETVMNDLDRAISDYDKAIALNSSSLELYRARGSAKFRSKDYEGAISDFNKVIELKPDAQYYTFRGMIQLQKGDLDKAIADFNISIEKSPSGVNSHALKGVAHFRKGDFDAAIVDYNDCIKLDPKTPDAYLNRALALLSTNKDLEAQKDFDRYLQLAPDKKAEMEKAIQAVKQKRDAKNP
jgi:tetratricopeptide (TPR) repeat protein